MSRLWQSGFELNTTAAGIEWPVTSGLGTVSSIQTGTVRSGSYALKLLANNANSGQFKFSFAASDQTAGFYFRVYINLAVAVSAATNIMIIRNAANFDKVGIRLNTDNSLTLRNIADATSIGSNTSPLSTGQWYRVEMFVDTTTISSTVVTALVDGVQFATGTTNLATGLASLVIGYSNIFATGTLYFDDVAINDSTGGNQNSYPGNGKILHLKPNAAGDFNDFSVQIGGTTGSTNNYTRVDEIPPDDATTYNASITINDTDFFNVDDSGIGANDSVSVVAVGARFAQLVGTDSTASLKFGLEKISGGTKSQSAAIIPNRTTWLTNQATPQNYPLVTYTDPNGGLWTQTTLDSMQIGYTVAAISTHALAVTSVWASVDYFSPLSINVSDSTSTSENIDIIRNSSRDSIVSDNTTTAESIQLLFTNNINTNDTVTTSENIKLLVTNFISVSDTVNTSENINLREFSISVSDTVNTSEFIDVLDNGTRSITVSDSLTASESTVILIDGTILINVFDTINSSENIDVLRDSSRDIKFLDSISVSEFMNILSDTQIITVEDDISTDEFVNIYPDVIYVTVSDSTITSEYTDVTRDGSRDITVFDNTPTSEFLNMFLSGDRLINTSDTIFSTENLLFNTAIANAPAIIRKLLLSVIVPDSLNFNVIGKVTPFVPTPFIPPTITFLVTNNFDFLITEDGDFLIV